jgi:hypothetical protein
LEHHWNIRYPSGDAQQAFPARAFVDYFAQRAKAGGDFDWHLAFHPYPENLFEPRFWNDQSATTQVLTTPRITFKNIELLPAYLRRRELRFKGQPRHIILSEQGFHTPDRPDGEKLQAAAFCYAYKKIERLDGIDAFILHRHVDNAAEGGPLLGLRSNRPHGAAASGCILPSPSPGSLRPHFPFQLYRFQLLASIPGVGVQFGQGEEFIGWLVALVSAVLLLGTVLLAVSKYRFNVQRPAAGGATVPPSRGSSDSGLDPQ